VDPELPCDEGLRDHPEQSGPGRRGDEEHRLRARAAERA
jgi:hypothetical protein